MLACLLAMLAMSPAPGTEMTFEFPELAPSLYTLVKGEAAVPRLTVQLPKDYEPGRAFPLVVLIPGSEGQTGDSARFARDTVGDSGVICVGVPSFKATIEPLKDDESNYWTRMMIRPDDGETCWSRYKVMFDRLLKEVPNVDREKTFFGGFSNGANTASAILSSSASGEFLDLFRHFLLIEGGLNARPDPKLDGAKFFLVRGAKNDRDFHARLKDVVKAQGASIEEFIMPDVGHEYSAEGVAAVRAWIHSEIKR